MSQIPESEQCKCANHNAANPLTAGNKSLFGGGSGAGSFEKKSEL